MKLSEHGITRGQRSGSLTPRSPVAHRPYVRPSGERGAMDEKIRKSDDQWKAELEPATYEVLRHKGTERAFTGRYWDCHERGVYVCAGCGNPLFSSETK